MDTLFGTEKTAVISPCGRYRYSLTRQWDEGKPGALFIMLNPSTANADVDDPTIRRCLGYAKSWQCGRLTVVNLFAYRATNPKRLFALADAAYGEAVGYDNDMHIRKALLEHCQPKDIVIAAWGAQEKRCGIRARIVSVSELLPRDLMCLEITKDGCPKHPLYCKANLIPIRYE